MTRIAALSFLIHRIIGGVAGFGGSALTTAKLRDALDNRSDYDIIIDRMGDIWAD